MHVSHFSISVGIYTSQFPWTITCQFIRNQEGVTDVIDNFSGRTVPNKTKHLSFVDLNHIVFQSHGFDKTVLSTTRIVHIAEFKGIGG
jgi:hypothetical protein